MNKGPLTPLDDDNQHLIGENLLDDPVLVESFGPKMSALNRRQQKFVLALMMSVSDNASQAAAVAGYSTNSREALGVIASRLRHNPRVLEAIHEEALKRLSGAKLLATQVLIEVASSRSTSASDRMKAANSILDRVGIATQNQHTVTVKHSVDEEAVVAEIKRFAAELGVDARQLLGQRGFIIEGDAVVDLGDPNSIDDVL